MNKLTIYEVTILLIIVIIVLVIFSSSTKVMIFWAYFKNSKQYNCTYGEFKKYAVDILNEIEKNCQNTTKNQVCSGIGVGLAELSASTSIDYKKISISYSWFEYLIKKEDVWKIALYHSIGHEIGHILVKENALLKNENKYCFVNRYNAIKWLEECFCDVIGLKFTINQFPEKTEEEILNCIEIKIKQKTKQKDRHKRKYPSYSFRKSVIMDSINFYEKTNDDILNIIRCKVEKEIKTSYEHN